jgi:hypothetical protein
MKWNEWRDHCGLQGLERGPLRDAIDQGNNHLIGASERSLGFGPDETVLTGVTHWRPLVRPSAPEWD